MTTFQIQKYYKNEPRFNGVYSRDNLTKIKDEAYVINLDEYSHIGTHWVSLYVNNNNNNNNDNNNNNNNKNNNNNNLWRHHRCYQGKSVGNPLVMFCCKFLTCSWLVLPFLLKYFF